MKKISFIALTALAVFSISCSKDIETPSQDTVKNPKVLYATTDNDITTKTALDGTSIIWTSSDEISAFDLDGNNYQSTKTVVSNNGKDALFEIGDLSIEDEIILALYPYSATATMDESGYIYTKIPTTQNIAADSFANGANVAVADGATNNLKFRNVGAFLCLTVGNDNLKSVKLSADEDMTGECMINYNNGEPIVEASVDYVELKGDFVKGQKYYFVVAPGEYNELTITLTDSKDRTATFKNSNTLTIARNENFFIGALPEVPEDKWVAKDPDTPTQSTTATWIAAEQGYTNGTQYNSATVDSNISLAFGDGGNDGKYYTTGSGIRIYANGKVTVSAANYAKISEIVLTYDSNYTGTISANPGDYKLSSTTGTWTGSASSVVLTNTASSGHARIQKITVKYTGGVATTTTYSVNIDDMIIGGIVSADPTTAGEGDEITLTAVPATGYEFDSWNVTNASSNEAITVTNDKFIMPAASVSVSAKFIKERTIADGEYILAGEHESIYYAAVKNDGTNNCKADVTLEPSEGKLLYAADKNINDLKLTITYQTSGEGAGLYTIVDANGKYLYAASTSSNHLKTKEAPDQDAYWEIIENTDNTHSIVAVKSTNRNVIRFNSTNTTPLISCYESAEKMDPVTLFPFSSLEPKQILEVCANPIIAIDESGVATISCPTNGATIYYTKGESPADPSNESDEYEGGIKLRSGETIKAIAYKDGMTQSGIASMVYINKFTGTIKFGTNDVKINENSVTGDDDLGNEWTIMTDGTTSYTANSTFYQVGSSNKPATSITFTTTLPGEVKVTEMSAKFGGFSGTAGSVDLKVDDTTIGTGSLNATNDVTIESTSTANGTVLTVTVTNITKGVKVYNISYTYEAITSTQE